MSIDNQFKNIPADSLEVKLMTRGLGSSYIELRVPPKDTRTEGRFLSEGSLLQGLTGTTSEFFPEDSQKKLDKLITGISALVNNANEIIGSGENKTNIQAILTNMASATKEATEAIKEIQGLAATGKTTLQNADVSITQLSMSLVATSDKIGELTKQMEGIAEKVNNGDGTAGKFINDGRLYEQLLEDSRQLEIVLKDIKSFVDQSKEKGLPLKLK